MKKSVLNGKRILAVDDETDVLNLVEEEILRDCPSCNVDRADSYESAAEMLKSRFYDVVILDIMGVKGFDLLELAVSRKFPVAMLTAHALSSDALERSIKLGARAYLPKEKMGEIVPFLEDLLNYKYLPGWKRLLKKLGGFFDSKFGPDWEKKADLEAWKEWHKWSRYYDGE